jgi:hypothetical protein
MNEVREATGMPRWLENAWLQRYLERELSDEEATWFEAYVLDKPTLVDAIEADNDLRDALAAAPAAAVVPVPRRSRHVPRWASAAAVVLACGISGWGGHWLSLKGAPVTIGNPTRLVFDTMRGAESPPRIEHADADTRWVVVEIAVPADAEAVRLQLGDTHDLVLSPSSEGFVSFAASRDALLGAREATLSYRRAQSVVERRISFALLNQRKRP